MSSAGFIGSGLVFVVVVIVLGVVLGVLIRHLGKIDKNKTNADMAKSEESPTQPEKNTVDDINLF